MFIRNDEINLICISYEHAIFFARKRWAHECIDHLSMKMTALETKAGKMTPFKSNRVPTTLSNEKRCYLETFC
jgi:hypothetical protein